MARTPAKTSKPKSDKSNDKKKAAPAPKKAVAAKIDDKKKPAKGGEDKEAKKVAPVGSDAAKVIKALTKPAGKPIRPPRDEDDDGGGDDDDEDFPIPKAPKPGKGGK